MCAKHLPSAFADLEEWVDDWGLSTEQERHLKLHSITIAELRPFYEAMMPRLFAILEHLDQFSTGPFPVPGIEAGFVRGHDWTLMRRS